MNPNALLGLSALIILGMAIFFFLKRIKQTKLPMVGRDALRKELWEKGWELKEIHSLGYADSFSEFGLAVLPFASYMNNYCLRIEATSEKGEDRDFIVKISLVFNKDVKVIDWKEAKF